MKATLNFGKVAYMGNRKDNPVTIDIELRQRGGEPTFHYKNGEYIPTGETTPTYTELSICGDIWNRIKTDIYCGGQCLDTISEYVKSPLFDEIYRLWERYHLNGMRAGTPEQMKALEDYKKMGGSNDYKGQCEYLKEVGLYEVPFTGLTVGKRYNGELYRYGCGWVIEELPKEVENRVIEIINTYK